DIMQSNDPDRPVTVTKTFHTQSPQNVDLQACPLDPAFAAKYPGAVMIDPGSFSYGGTTVTFEDCVEPGSGGGVKPVCPGESQGTGTKSAALDLDVGGLQRLASLNSVSEQGSFTD